MQVHLTFLEESFSPCTRLKAYVHINKYTYRSARIYALDFYKAAAVRNVSGVIFLAIFSSAMSGTRFHSTGKLF